jgi:hypothetical protein
MKKILKLVEAAQDEYSSQEQDEGVDTVQPKILSET